MYLFRALSFCCCVFSLAASILFWIGIEYIGFPDGYITDFDRVKIFFNSIGMFSSVIFSGYCFYAGLFYPKKIGMSIFQKYLAGYVLFMAGLFIAGEFFGSYFNDGRGG